MLTKEMFIGRHTPMQDADIIKAAETLEVEPAVIQAVIAVETSGSPYDRDGRPKILFEAHLFGKYTSHKYDNHHDPHGKAISSRQWNRTLYNGAGEWQYVRMFAAFDLDPVAAVKATSWGAFQIIGNNYVAAGFDTIEDFVVAMADSAGKHLLAFVSFVQNNHLDDELQDQRWKDFARQYNGPGYAANHYDTKMATEYRKLAAQWARRRIETSGNNPTEDETPDYEPSRKTVAAVQAALNAMPRPPQPPLQVDGYVGPKTTKAVLDFEKEAGLPDDGGIIDRVLLERLGITAEAT